MDKNICIHTNLEKINDQIYICKNCSLIRMIKFKNNNDKTKLLLTKDTYYNIKYEINILHLTKNAINYKDIFFSYNKEEPNTFKKN